MQTRQNGDVILNIEEVKVLVAYLEKQQSDTDSLLWNLTHNMKIVMDMNIQNPESHSFSIF